MKQPKVNVVSNYDKVWGVRDVLRVEWRNNEVVAIVVDFGDGTLFKPFEDYFVNERLNLIARWV